MRKSIRNVMGILTAVLLVGCSQSSSILKSQMYLGQELPKDQIAVITGWQISEYPYISTTKITSFSMIHMVDGQVVQQNGIPIKGAYDAREVHVLPGFHEVVARVNLEVRSGGYFDIGGRSCNKCTRLLTFNFEAEAGHTYIVVEPQLERGKIVSRFCKPQVIHIIDEATRKIVVSKEVDSFSWVGRCD